MVLARALQRQGAFYTLAHEAGIPAAQLQPMVDVSPDLFTHREMPEADAHSA